MIQQVGIVGLGNIGSVIAQRLAQHMAVLGYDQRPERLSAAAEHGIRPAATLAEVASQAATIMLSLPSPAISRQVVQAMLEHLRPGSLIIETSTVTPRDMTLLANLCRPAGIALIDAAIHGGVGNVADGRFAWLVGGAEDDVARARPVLALLTPDIVMLGPLGTGMAAKVINNAVVHAVMVVLAEAAALTAAASLPMASLYELLRRETGLLRPLTHRFRERIMRGQYEGGMSTDNARKDSVLALQMAHAEGVPLFAIQAAHTVYEIAAREGLGPLDYAAIARLWESWLAIDLAGENGAAQ